MSRVKLRLRKKVTNKKGARLFKIKIWISTLKLSSKICPYVRRIEIKFKKKYFTSYKSNKKSSMTTIKDLLKITEWQRV